MKAPLFILKWTHYEYWPWWFFYLPLVPYWLWLATKTKSLAFFTATNTNIELGGFFGESKIDILNQIGPQYLPMTYYNKLGTSWDELKRGVEKQKLGFPLITKPNIGERGFQVEKVMDWAQLEQYHSSARFDYIIQEFVDYPIELGILFCRLPSEVRGKVTSVTLKDFLKVKGDGESSIEELMGKDTRARLQLASMKKKLNGAIKQVVPRGEERLLEPIGNHCRGTRFVNGQQLINEELHSVFARITANMDGFYFGRFDLKVKSLEDLYQGKHIKIMELNGASSEPGHIYDALGGLLKAYKDLAYHWSLLAAISLENRKKGIHPAPFRTIVQVFFQHFGA